MFMEYCCLSIVERRRRRRRISLSLIISLLCLCSCTTFISNPKILSESMSLLSMETDGISSKSLKRNCIETRGRRLLGGPGSSPPRCQSKCKGCTPCKRVHVTVPPGTPVTEEYYPEAWRCKCRNKLYMP